MKSSSAPLSFWKKMMLLELDLAGAEWVVVAYLCKDPAMLDVVKSGKSPHVVTGARMSGVSEELVLQEEAINGKISDPEVISANRRSLDLAGATFLPRTMSIRQAAKRANHGLNYAEGYKTFALTNEMEEREAKRIVDLYNKRAYPNIPKWHAALDEQIRKTRTLTNFFQRKVYLMGQISSELYKQGYAFIPQSTVVDSCNQAMVKMTEDDSVDFRPAQLLAQVHDSLLTQYLSRDFNAMARYCIKLGRDYMRPVIDYGDPFQLKTDLKVGFSWGKLKDVPLTDDPDALAVKLAETCDYLRSTKKAA